MRKKMILISLAIFFLVVFLYGILLISRQYCLNQMQTFGGRFSANENWARKHLTESAKNFSLDTDPENHLVHISNQIMGPDGVPQYLQPLMANDDFSRLGTNSAKQGELQKLIDKNIKTIDHLHQFYMEKKGIQDFSKQDLSTFLSNGNKIIYLYTDLTALAILENNQTKAEELVYESFYSLKVMSFSPKLFLHAQFSALTYIWLIEIYGQFVNHFDLPIEKRMQLIALLRECNELIEISFKNAVLGECFSLNEEFASSRSCIDWRSNQFNDYFVNLETRPWNWWYLEYQVFKIADQFLNGYGNFNQYYTFKDAFAQNKKAMILKNSFVQRYCIPFFLMYQGSLFAFTQIKCNIIEMYAGIYWKQHGALPHSVAALYPLGLKEDDTIDPYTGKKFQLEISPPKIGFMHRENINSILSQNATEWVKEFPIKRKK